MTESLHAIAAAFGLAFVRSVPPPRGMTLHSHVFEKNVVKVVAMGNEEDAVIAHLQQALKAA